VVLATNSFTLKEVNLLAETLNKKWNLVCHVNIHKLGYRIVISSKSTSLLQTLLMPIMPSMMRYKIGL
jgi:hypothetical protein